MNTTQLNHYKQILENKLQELEQLVWEREGISIERSADVIDEIQNATMREMAIRNLDHETQLLRAVRAPLTRIEEDTFGICQRCEEEISPKRIAAIAWTPYCIRCQEVMDQRETIEWAQTAA